MPRLLSSRTSGNPARRAPALRTGRLTLEPAAFTSSTGSSSFVNADFCAWASVFALPFFQQASWRFRHGPNCIGAGERRLLGPVLRGDREGRRQLMGEIRKRGKTYLIRYYREGRRFEEARRATSGKPHAICCGIAKATSRRACRFLQRSAGCGSRTPRRTCSAQSGGLLHPTQSEHRPLQRLRRPVCSAG